MHNECLSSAWRGSTKAVDSAMSIPSKIFKYGRKCEIVEIKMLWQQDPGNRRPIRQGKNQVLTPKLLQLK